MKGRLAQIFYQSYYLCQLVSHSVPICDITDQSSLKISEVARKLFVSCCLYEANVSPSLWVFCNVAPEHFKLMYDTFGFGLGINTMEGREQKHQLIKKYSEKAVYQCRWDFIFRHEFIQTVYLRENGFDDIKYTTRPYKYIPDILDGQCDCSLQYFENKCEICDSNFMKEEVHNVEKHV